MNSEKTFWTSITNLHAIFSGNPIFNILYRCFTICCFTTLLSYSFIYFISNHQKLSVWVSFAVLIITFSIFSYFVLHLPNKTGYRHLYIMLYSNSKDTTLVINGLTQKCRSLSKSKEYIICCPNKSCRYFYNWVNSKSSSTDSIFFRFINKYINKKNIVLLYGALNDEQSNSRQVSKVIPSITTSTSSDSIINVTTMIENTSFVIRHNDSFNDLDTISQMILSYADYIFSIFDKNPQIKNLNTMLDIYENAKKVSTNFPQDKFIQIIEEMSSEITSKPIDENQINEYIIFCKRFLEFFPNNERILLDMQFYSISRIRNKTISTLEIKKIAEYLLSISNISLSNKLNGIVLELNRAYLLLLTEDFDSAINIYRRISTIPPHIYSFFIETKDSPSLGNYSKFAFIINYYFDVSSPNHSLAVLYAQSLKDSFKDNQNSPLYKSFQKFIKRKKTTHKNRRLF